MSSITLEIHFNCQIDASGAPELVPDNAPRLDVTTTPWELVLHPFDREDPDDEEVIFTVSPPSGYSITVSSSGTPSGAWTEDGSDWVSAAIDEPQDHGIIVSAVPDSNPSAPPVSSTTTITIEKPGKPFDLGTIGGEGEA
ncbi:MAG: hypothetical protein KC420_00420 [Myxococcales bacterium]|nr:hypothetical protein [Myxococcales bacterium]MCB9706709.1 hypothetical protein [Myxococcales bacterium]